MTPFYQDEAVCIYHGDCRDVFASGVLPIVDHVITDPPYDATTHAGARTGGDGSIVLPIDFDPLDVDVMAPLLLNRVSRWTVAFCALEMLGDYKRIAGDRWVRAGFWRKPNGAPQFTGDRPGQPGEGLAICHQQGRKRWNGGGLHAYWDTAIDQRLRVHPTQKPEALMARLVTDFTDAGESICDPFMGSGTTLVAAKRLGRKAIGIERELKYCEMAVERLRQGALDMFSEVST